MEACSAGIIFSTLSTVSITLAFGVLKTTIRMAGWLLRNPPVWMSSTLLITLETSETRTIPCSFAGPTVVICDVAKLLTAGAFTLFGVPAMIWLAADPSDVFGEVAETVLEDALVVAVLIVVLI